MGFTYACGVYTQTAIESDEPMSTEPIHKLFVTLTRSYAGTKRVQKAVLENLGFTYRFQTLEKPNNAPIRGAINKVRHLVRVEADYARAARLAEEEKRREQQPPLSFKHP